MDFAQWVHAVEYSGVGQWMRTSVKGLPIVEATHVACAAIVFGTVFVVDLRLIGVPHNQRPVTLISEEMLRLTWGAFVISVVTGTLMFTANAHTYVVNTAFRIKMLALLCRRLGQGSTGAPRRPLGGDRLDLHLGRGDLPGTLDRFHQGLCIRSAAGRCQFQFLGGNSS